MSVIRWQSSAKFAKTWTGIYLIMLIKVDVFTIFIDQPPTLQLNLHCRYLFLFHYERRGWNNNFRYVLVRIPHQDWHHIVTDTICIHFFALSDRCCTSFWALLSFMFVISGGTINSLTMFLFFFLKMLTKLIFSLGTTHHSSIIITEPYTVSK